MSHYKSYPAYKDSCVEWIGKVPEHWIVSPFKWQIEQNDGGVWGIDADGTDDTIVLRSTEQTVDGQWRMDNPERRKLSAAEKNSALLAEGDLVVTKSSGSSLHIGKTTIVSPEIAAMGCCYSNFMQRIRLKTSFKSTLAWYVMNNDIARQQFDLLSNSTTGLANLNGTMIGQMFLAVPPMSEQSTIVAALDRETARIDALIAKKTEFIKLLAKKRQALITHAVTKGLNPKAKMKDSGVEWIGEVPEHWMVPALKFLVSTPITDGPHETPTPADADNGVLFISAEAMSSGVIDFNKAWGYILRADHERYAKKYRPMINDIYMIKSGATTGITAMVEDNREFNIWSPLAAIRPGEKVAPRFLLNALRTTSFRDGVVLNWSYGTQQNIGMKVIETLRVPLPPLNEQELIIKALDQETSRIDLLAEKTRLSIDLLKKRRSALITAAVTGQIDLRGGA